MTIKNLSYIKTKSVSPLYLIIDEINVYTEEINGNIYLMLAPTDESKDPPQKYEELWNKIKDLIKSATNNSDNCDKKYKKIKINSDDYLPLKKTLELHNMVKAVRSVFNKESKYISSSFLRRMFV